MGGAAGAQAAVANIYQHAGYPASGATTLTDDRHSEGTRHGVRGERVAVVRASAAPTPASFRAELSVCQPSAAGARPTHQEVCAQIQRRRERKLLAKLDGLQSWGEGQREGARARRLGMAEEAARRMFCQVCASLSPGVSSQRWPRPWEDRPPDSHREARRSMPHDAGARACALDSRPCTCRSNMSDRNGTSRNTQPVRMVAK